MNQHNIVSCEQAIERYYREHPDVGAELRARKALHALSSCNSALLGEPAGWAAGIIYAIANDAKIPCGIPGLLNSNAEAYFGVSMGTIRKRAGQIAQMLAV